MPLTSVLQDPFLLNSLKWSEIEDLLTLEVFQYTRREPFSQQGLLNIYTMDSGQFRTFFRFDRDDVDRLTRALQLPDVVKTPQCVTISGVECLCVTPRRLAHHNRLRDLELLFFGHDCAARAHRQHFRPPAARCEQPLLAGHRSTQSSVRSMQLFSFIFLTKFSFYFS